MVFQLVGYVLLLMVVVMAMSLEPGSNTAAAGTFFGWLIAYGLGFTATGYLGRMADALEKMEKK